MRKIQKHFFGKGLWGMASKCIAAIVLAVTSTATPALAGTHTTSTNIALIPNTTGSGFGGGAAGTFVTSWFPQYSITIVNPNTVTPGSLSNYDTVILWQYCNVGSLPSFTSNLVSWLQINSGKLVIWDADSCPSSTSYAWLAPLGATFDRFSPNGIGGSGGSLRILDESALGSANPASPYYINAALIGSGTDALNDLTTVNENTASPVWCANMRGTNGLNRSGFAHMYSKPGGLNGAPDAMIIYSGLDSDNILAPSTSAGGQIGKLLGLDLAHGWGPPGSAPVADLTCQVPVGNLVMTPVNATNLLGQTHTVVATVSVQNPSAGTTPVAGDTVSFAIVSGPNAGTTGTAVTDTNGQCSFSWVGALPGTDTLMASTTVNGLLKTFSVTKVWIATAAPDLFKYSITADTNVTAGQTFTYELSFDTFSNTTAAVGLKLVDHLPLEVDFVSATSNGVDSVYDPGTHTIIWDFGTFPPLTQGPTNYVTVQVNASAVAGGNILNTASIISSNLPGVITHDRNPRCPTCADGTPVAANRPPVALCTNVTVSAGTSNCVGNASVDNGSFDPDGDPITITQVPTGPYPIGTNSVCLVVTDNKGASNSCCAVVTVVDSTPPTVNCPGNIVATNEPGLCSARVSFVVSASDCTLVSLTTDYASGSAFPVGSTAVTATAADAAGHTNTCSFTITVLDKEAPVASCRPAPNPSSKKIPTAGKNPSSGQNPDGYFQLLGKDNCDPDCLLYLHDTDSGFVAGPFHSGDIIKLRQSPGSTPSSTPDSPPIVAQIRLNGDGALYAVDSAGNVSAASYCMVPPPPK